ncbi:uncharacterized protein LOC122079637 [Macadamia integrifolia]|uniref:uncharacterized protein LOC122079637 n=1 Tax=Macadamia integrifolia TaxID=60698 RepID=UPI001C4FF72A|nr:uncharacterized protein LOC122079637 [Macadamia integrifolia]
MLGMGTFRLPCESYPAIATIPQVLTASSLSAPCRTFKTNSLFPHSNSSSTFLFLQGQHGFSLCASKKRTGRNNTLLETDGHDDEEEEEEEDEEADEGEVFVPFENMKKWAQNKPPGFGEGKMYHTSIEDKLLEEMEQSRKAQLANINNLKNNPPNPKSEKQPKVLKAPEVVPSGIRVRVENLPKKKNIHRDLKLAFQGFPGILNISPAVSGNKKTKDPICKGFAFVDLDSEEAAFRFIHRYGRQSLPFGKIQKQITCEMINPSSSLDNAFQQSPNGSSTSISKLTLPILKENTVADSDVNNLSMDLLKLTTLDESAGPMDQIMPADWEDIEEDPECVNVWEPNDVSGMKATTELVNESVSSKQQQKSRAVQKKKIVKTKSAKVPKLSISASAKRLKVKEKAVLTGAFSKYGVKSPS